MKRGIPVLDECGALVGWFRVDELLVEAAVLSRGLVHFAIRQDQPWALIGTNRGRIQRRLSLALYLEEYHTPPYQVLVEGCEGDVAGAWLMVMPEERRLCLRARGADLGLLPFCVDFVPVFPPRYLEGFDLAGY